MTLRELEDHALVRLAFNLGQVPPEIRERVRQSLNDWHRRICTRPGFHRLLNDSTSGSFASVASQTVYGLPAGLGRLIAIRETTNDVHLVRRDLGWLRMWDPGDEAVGVPEAYAPLGTAPVQRQPGEVVAAGGTVEAVSSSASDTAEITVGYRTASGPAEQRTTLTGTSAVSVTPASTLEVISLAVESPAIGTITIQETVTPTTLGLILPGETTARYHRIRLWPTPQGAITYLVDFTRTLEELADDTAEPIFPPEFHHLLSLGAQFDEYLRKDDNRATIVRADLDNELRKMADYVWNTLDYQPGSRRGGRRSSRLGAWFASGS